MLSIRTFTLAAGLACATLAACVAPAEAGRRTGTWKYSPEEVYAAQRAQRHQQYRQQRYGYGRGYDRGYGRGYGQGYGYGPARQRYVNPEAPAWVAGPGGGGPGTYGRP